MQPSETNRLIGEPQQANRSFTGLAMLGATALVCAGVYTAAAPEGTASLLASASTARPSVVSRVSGSQGRAHRAVPPLAAGTPESRVVRKTRAATEVRGTQQGTETESLRSTEGERDFVGTEEPYKSSNPLLGIAGILLAAGGAITVAVNKLFKEKTSAGANKNKLVQPVESLIPVIAMNAIAGEEGYGRHCFKGVVAEKYLVKHGLTAKILEDPNWPKTHANEVAAALVEWAKDNGANVFTHWFQPLGAAGVRPGHTGQVYNNMFVMGKDNQAKVDFDGGNLLQGETDGSSYPNGGLRATHTAGGYTILDPTTNIFMRGDTVFAPACFITFHGQAIDEKTPLLRAQQAMSKEAVRLMKHLGWEIDGLSAQIGLEQEYFLIPRDVYYKRPDLQMTGRTVMGRDAPRGQELCDHYMGAMNPAAEACILELQEACYAMGIPLRTRHREVAPNQYECAPMFGIAQEQIDQNLMVMQLLEEIAAKHNMACLLQEKPFAGINGSGKHNNWSLTTPEGVNLFNPKQLNKASGKMEIFPIIMCAMIQGLDKYGDLMRMSIATPGNDFRLGACEAPPAIMTTYFGDDLTSYLEKFVASGGDPTATGYVPGVKQVPSGIDFLGSINIPAEDRNRTSPFPYGGNRFEFRAVGSAQNVSMVNTVLGGLVADAFASFSEQIEAGAKPEDVACKAFEEHSRVIFNGNGYSEEWPVEAVKRGLPKIDSSVDAMAVLKDNKNVSMFERHSIMTKEESFARASVMMTQYAGIVEMEAKCFIDMVNKHVLPSLKAADIPVGDVQSALKSVEAKVHQMEAEEDEYKKASIARELRLETMIEARVPVDNAEALCPEHLWTLATYKDLLFLDSHAGHTLMN